MAWKAQVPGQGEQATGETLKGLRADKLRVDISRAKKDDELRALELAREHGKTMSRDDWAQDMNTLAQVCAAGFDEAMRVVEALCTDHAAVAGVRGGFDALRARIAEDAKARGWEK